MAWIEKVKQFATGKTELERKQEVAAMSQIRKEAMAAGYQEKREQAKKFAVERERYAYEQRIKALRQPKPGFFSGAGGFGSPWGQPRSTQALAPAPSRVIYVKKGKHYVKKTVKGKARSPQAPAYHDVLGLGSFGGGKKIDVLGI